MAQVLGAGGFATEALAPLRESVEKTVQALALWQGHEAETPPALGLIDSALVQTKLLPAETLSLVARLREDPSAADEAVAGTLLTQGERLLSRAAAVLGSVPE